MVHNKLTLKTVQQIKEEKMMNDDENLLIQIFREVDAQAKMNIITTCMNELDWCRSKKKVLKKVGNGKIIDFDKAVSRCQSD